MKQFVINEHGVCTNPNRITFKSGNCKFSLETAIVNGRWIMGYHFYKAGNGTVSPCTGTWKEFFSSERDALKYAAHKAMEFFREKHYTPNNSDKFAVVPDDIIKSLQTFITPQPVQLSLFDL